MPWLLLGLLIFLGTHSLQLIAPQWRQRQADRLGAPAFKILYALIAIAGFSLALVGYGQTRTAPVMVWDPPLALWPLTALLMLPALILLVAAYVPRNHFKQWLGHPMLVATQIWALSHILVNGRLGDLVFFGSFLLWSAALAIRLRKNDRINNKSPAAGQFAATAICLAVGTGLWFLTARYLHIYIAGVPALA